jgi:hypothetical protein
MDFNLGKLYDALCFLLNGRNVCIRHTKLQPLRASSCVCTAGKEMKSCELPNIQWFCVSE